MLERFLNGTTGIGLIDASQREIYLTGYTSNRARLNAVSFLVHYLCIDWRWGAEWYEYLLVDYDVSSNWGNCQYAAGVGNDPRGGRSLNPVKQALEYDPKGEYIKLWVPETRGLTNLGEIFQPWTCRDETLKKDTGLQGLEWVEEPLKKIDFKFGKQKQVGRGRGGERGPGEGRGRGYERSRGLGGLSGSPDTCGSEKEDGEGSGRKDEDEAS
jgi:deoxyribodipyrimidine photo-lyase